MPIIVGPSGEVPWSFWFNRVLPYVPRCSEPMASDAISRAAADFCMRTRVYRVDHEALDAVAGQGSYQWTPGPGLKVVRAELVWFDGKQLTPRTVVELDAIFQKWQDEEGTPQFYVQEKVEELILVPKPAAALTDAIVAKVSVMPGTQATGLEQTLAERYIDEIAAGALRELLMMPKQAWTDFELGRYHGGVYEDGVGKVSLATTKGHTRATVSPALRRRRFM